MRFVVQLSFSTEKFNNLVANGTIGDKIGAILDDIQPEAVYFTATDGNRGGYLVVDLDSASQLPSIAEPFFLTFDAKVAFHPCMSPEDLGAAGLDELGTKWS
jgi:hypothetical protein